MQKRNVYDFDNTIYRGDSSVDFYRFCARRHPRMLADLPAVGTWFACMGLGLVEKTRVKQRLYRFLTLLPDTNALVAAFWEARRGRLKPWYLAQRRDEDVIISASPEFLLRPVCDALHVTLLASRVDPRTGRYTGRNCHGAEKARRLKEALPECAVEAFYSDSLSDAPLAGLAARAFFVKGDRLLPWPRV